MKTAEPLQSPLAQSAHFGLGLEPNAERDLVIGLYSSYASGYVAVCHSASVGHVSQDQILCFTHKTRLSMSEWMVCQLSPIPWSKLLTNGSANFDPRGNSPTWASLQCVQTHTVCFKLSQKTGQGTSDGAADGVSLHLFPNRYSLMYLSGRPYSSSSMRWIIGSISASLLKT